MAEPRTEPAGTQKTTGPELRRTQTIAGGALLLTVLAAVSAPRNPEPSDFLDLGERFFPNFEDPEEALSLEVIEFDEATAEAIPFRVQNENGIWTIPSHHDYPADGKDRLAQTAAGIMLLEKDDFRSENVADHAALGVVDPLDEGEVSLVGRGRRVTVKASGDRALADLIIGRQVEDREGAYFVRVPGQKARLCLESRRGHLGGLRRLDRTRSAPHGPQPRGRGHPRGLHHQRTDPPGGPARPAVVPEGGRRVERGRPRIGRGGGFLRDERAAPRRRRAGNRGRPAQAGGHCGLAHG